jgi:hypothetical protein
MLAGAAMFESFPFASSGVWVMGEGSGERGELLGSIVREARFYVCPREPLVGIADRNIRFRR